jgi:hypothetical protein
MTRAMKLAAAYFNRDFYLTLDEAGALAGLTRTPEETAHQALSDARYTARVMRRLRTAAQKEREL